MCQIVIVGEEAGKISIHLYDIIVYQTVPQKQRKPAHLLIVKGIYMI
jgi:hypothetical protein